MNDKKLEPYHVQSKLYMINTCMRVQGLTGSSKDTKIILSCFIFQANKIRHELLEEIKYLGGDFGINALHDFQKLTDFDSRKEYIDSLI